MTLGSRPVCRPLNRRSSRQRLEKAGRDPDAVEVSVYWCPPQRDTVLRLRQGGVHRVIFMVDPVAGGGAIAQLDEYAEVMAACG